MTQERDEPGWGVLIPRPGTIGHSLGCAVRDFNAPDRARTALQKTYDHYTGTGDPYVRGSDEPYCTQVQVNAGTGLMMVTLGLAAFVAVARSFRGSDAPHPIPFAVSMVAGGGAGTIGAFVLLSVLGHLPGVAFVVAVLAALFGLFCVVYSTRVGTPIQWFRSRRKRRAERKNDRLLQTARAVDVLRKDPKYDEAMAELDRMLTHDR
jgi:hypothetical protein